MIMGKKKLDRIEDLKRNEELLYECLDYLTELWSINRNKREMRECFEMLSFTDEDIKRLGICFDEDNGDEQR